MALKVTVVLQSLISGRIPRPNTPKSQDIARCSSPRLHLLLLLPTSSVHSCVVTIIAHHDPLTVDHHSANPILIMTLWCPTIAVHSNPQFSSWLRATHWTEVDFVSLRLPRYHCAPVGLKASRSVFLDPVFLSLLILPGHHHSYIDVYPCLQSPFEPHTNIFWYRSSFFHWCSLFNSSLSIHLLMIWGMYFGYWCK